MGKYSIKELEQLSGIKAHTIRIWEKRHRLIEPHRTPTNIRYYSDDDLKKIINVSVLNSNGFKISKIAGMSRDEISHTIMELSETKTEAMVHIDQLVVSMVDLDEEKFEKVLSGLILRFGFETAVIEIIYPFLEKIGILWQTHNITPAQEHFISNLIRQKLMVAVDSLPIAPKTSGRAILFLPENEMHELGLLFYHYLVRKAGFRTYYLGQMVPHQDLLTIYAVHKPDILITSIITAVPKDSLQRYLKKLSTDFKRSTVIVGGSHIMSVHSKFPNIQFLRNVNELLGIIKAQ